MKIRKASSKDKMFIVASQVRMAQESEELSLDEKIVGKGVEHILTNPEIGFYLIAEDGEQACACLLVLKEWSDWRAGNVLWIHSVFVLKPHRKKGVFSKMYQTLKNDVIQDDELQGLRLYVDKTNLNAIKVYEKLGMNSEHYHMYEWMKNF